MGLGLIAFGFILLEGITIGINSMKLVPEYISIVIMLIGILVVLKKIKIKYFNYALVLGVIQFIYYFLTPQLEIGLAFIDLLMPFVDIVLRLGFYAMLFKGIDSLVNNSRTRFYMKSFWIVYALLSVYLLVYYFMTNSQYSYQSNITVSNTIFNTILLACKTILCYVISYRLYKHNKELADEYEELNVEQIRSYPQLTYIVVMLLSVVLIVVLYKPVFYTLADSAQRRYVWYGSIENEIIIEDMAIEEKRYIHHLETTYQYPSIWINENDFQSSEYFSISANIGDDEYIFMQNEMIDRDNEYRPDDGYFNGKMDGYERLIYDVNCHDYDKIYNARKNISINVILYNKDMEIVEEYHVPLADGQPRLTEYHYQDDEMKVEGFKVDNDFIIQMPRITFNKKLPEEYKIFISASPTFDGYHIITSVAQTDEAIERFGKFIYEETFTHIYLPARQDYYIHIAYFENDTPHIVKTVRLEK